MQLLLAVFAFLVLIVLGQAFVEDASFRLTVLTYAAVGCSGASFLLLWVRVQDLRSQGLRDPGLSASALRRARVFKWASGALFALSCIWLHDATPYTTKVLFYTAMPPLQEQYLSLGCYGWKATKADEGGVLNPEFINQPRVLIWKQGQAGGPYYQEAYRIPQGVLFCSFFNKWHGHNLDWQFVPWENFDFRMRKALRDAPEVKP